MTRKHLHTRAVVCGLEEFLFEGALHGEALLGLLLVPPQEFLFFFWGTSTWSGHFLRGDASEESENGKREQNVDF